MSWWTNEGGAHDPYADYASEAGEVSAGGATVLEGSGSSA
jgi:hypothetical protein